jgi:hypothetical protein
MDTDPIKMQARTDSVRVQILLSVGIGWTEITHAAEPAGSHSHLNPRFSGWVNAWRHAAGVSKLI